ncbi:amidohydrolase family protein [Saccharopolyspora sp. NPDC000995]
MFTQLRMTVAAHRSSAGRQLSAREVLSWATSHGAAACGVAHRTGSLTPGKKADLVLPRADDVNLSPLTACAEALHARGTLRATSTQCWSPTKWSSVTAG